MKLLLIALILNFGLNRVEAGTMKDSHQGRDNSSHRIREVYHNLSLPGKVYMIPTFASSILIPCVIEDVLIGQAEGFSYLISKKSPKRLELNTTTEAQTTNLIVYCSEKVFVFDLIVQFKTHNDVVILGGSFGGPEVEMQRSKYQDERVNSAEHHTAKVTTLNTVTNEVYSTDNNTIHNIPHIIPSNEPDSPIKSYLMTDKEVIGLLKSSKLKNISEKSIKDANKDSILNSTKNSRKYFDKRINTNLEVIKSSDNKVNDEEVGVR
jgi:hypothetical protein